MSPQSQAKERVKRTMENPREVRRNQKCSGKGKTSKTGISGLENLKSETNSETQESVQMAKTSWIHDPWNPDEWNDGWSLNEWNDDWSGVGWHEDGEQTYNISVSSFSLESSERVNTNLDTRAAVNTFLVNFDREGVGDGSFYDWIQDGVGGKIR